MLKQVATWCILAPGTAQAAATRSRKSFEYAFMGKRYRYSLCTEVETALGINEEELLASQRQTARRLPPKKQSA